MNFARSLGPAVVTGFPYSNLWVYLVGPFLGSLLGAGFYSLIKHYRYWKLNPDQATVDTRKSPGDPIDMVRSIVEANTSRSPDHSDKREDTVSRDQHGIGTGGSGSIIGRRQQMNDSLV